MRCRMEWVGGMLRVQQPCDGAGGGHVTHAAAV